MPSNTQFNTIFQGVSPKPIRDAMASFAHDNKFDKIIMPCVGRFAGAEAIIRAGVAPSKIITGDISLFSSVLGYYFADKDLSELKITSDFDFINPGSAPEFYAASVLYGIKVCQAKDNTYYAAQLKEALLRNPQARIQALANSLKELKTAMGGGINYQLIDMNDMLDAWIDNENACIILSPPAYGAKGYVKMFDFKKHIQWDEPRIKQFGAKGDMEKLADKLKDAKATVMLEIFRDRSALKEEDWQTYQLVTGSDMKNVYLFLNKRAAKVNISRPRLVRIRPLPYPIITPKDEITEGSVLSAVEVNLDVANYYRDLFTHKLGASMADINILFLVDNKIIGIRGYTIDQKSSALHEIYGIVHNNTKYRHLNRLLMRVITTKKFAELANNTFFDLKEITSTKISQYPEWREAKGILSEYMQEDLKGGLTKTKYRAGFMDKPWSDCVKEWLKEEANYGRNKEKRKPKMRATGGTGR